MKLTELDYLEQAKKNLNTTYNSPKVRKEAERLKQLDIKKLQYLSKVSLSTIKKAQEDNFKNTSLFEKIVNSTEKGTYEIDLVTSIDTLNEIFDYYFYLTKNGFNFLDDKLTLLTYSDIADYFYFKENLTIKLVW